MEKCNHYDPYNKIRCRSFQTTQRSLMSKGILDRTFSSAKYLIRQDNLALFLEKKPFSMNKWGNNGACLVHKVQKYTFQKI